MSSPRPLALLSNDDGVASPGLAVMRAALEELFDVVVLAPETEQSASSHALSLHRPLRLRQLEDGIFALDGTPADCVYDALHGGTRVVVRRPDLVVSGIAADSTWVKTSSTRGPSPPRSKAAPSEAFPASRRGVPTPNADLPAVAKLGTRIASELLAKGPRGVLLNLNVPRRWTGEVRAAKLGSRIYEEAVDFRTDPRGREYLWLGGPGVRHERNEGTDTDAYDDGAASLTPLVLDLTHAEDGGLAVEIVTKVRARTTPQP